MVKNTQFVCGFTFIFILNSAVCFAMGRINREAKVQSEKDKMQEEFSWWPTDAQPAPVKDENGGWWWWPKNPGTNTLWGNRGYCFVDKIIFDYQQDDLPPPKKGEMRASLLIKSITKNVKIYFDYNKAELRDDAVAILEDASRILSKNPEKNILITGNCDKRGSEKYNEKLGRKRAEAVKEFMISNGIPEENIRIVSRGKFDAIAPINDIVGMQKDRNAQFMIAEVEEVMIPYGGAESEPLSPEEMSGQEVSKEDIVIVDESTVEENLDLESEVKVSEKTYTVKKGDTLWKIAQSQLGSGHRWKYLFEINRDTIKDPVKLKAGQKIKIPVE